MTTTFANDRATPVSPDREAYPPVSGYPRARGVRIVTIPNRRCLAIDGEAEPGGAEFQEAMGALYGTAYSLHFLLRDRGIDAHIGPPEALWTRRDGSSGWSEGAEAFDPGAWRWTLLMAVPDEATDVDIESAVAVTRRKRPLTGPCRDERPDLRGGPRGRSHACRAICRRAGDHRQDAGGGRRGRADAPRPAPRDLSRRSIPDRAPEPSNGAPAACQAMIRTRSWAARRRRQLRQAAGPPTRNGPPPS